MCTQLQCIPHIRTGYYITTYMLYQNDNKMCFMFLFRGWYSPGSLLSLRVSLFKAMCIGKLYDIWPHIYRLYPYRYRTYKNKGFTIPTTRLIRDDRSSRYENVTKTTVPSINQSSKYRITISHVFTMFYNNRHGYTGL